MTYSQSLANPTMRKTTVYGLLSLLFILFISCSRQENLEVTAPSEVGEFVSGYTSGEIGSSDEIGITLAKKCIRKANQRNRIKRLIRESFRHRTQQLPNIDIVVVGKTGADNLTNDEIYAVLDKLWKKLAKRCNSH